MVRLITCFIDKRRAFATSGLFFSMSLRVKLSIVVYSLFQSLDLLVRTRWSWELNLLLDQAPLTAALNLAVPADACAPPATMRSPPCTCISNTTIAVAASPDTHIH